MHTDPTWPNVVTLVGIDPGTRYLGYCTMHVRLPHLELMDLNTITIEPHRYHIDRDNELFRNRLFYVKPLLHDELLEHFLEDQPHVIACESPYIDRFRPGAYGPLVEIMSTIQRAVVSFSPSMPFYTVPPSIAKKAIGAKAFAKKEEIAQVILKHPELSPFLKDIPDLTEHSIDAVAIAYSHLSVMRLSALYARQ